MKADVRQDDSPEHSTNIMLKGGGEMGDYIRNFAWDKTAIGDIAQWPISVRAAVNICINSRFPMVLWLGEDLNILYNNDWAPILGKRHPEMLGAPGRDVWPEIWDIIGPMLQGVVDTGEATWSENMLLPLERNGFTEECYFTYSYSPIYSDSGKAEGAFTAVTETTLQVIRQRRLATLKDLGIHAEGETYVSDAALQAMEILAKNPFDFPLSLYYRLTDDKQFEQINDVPKQSHEFNKYLPLSEVVKTQSVVRFTLETGYPVTYPDNDWGSEVSECCLYPIFGENQSVIMGVLVCAIAPWLKFDEDYQTFLELTRKQIENSIASAQAYEIEVERANRLAELDRAKSQFFSNVSHELRTPLTLIMAPLEELLQQNNNLDGHTADTLELMRRNTARLQKLVNGILDFSRIEGGKLKPTFELIDLASYTTGLASLFRSAVESTKMKLIVDCKPLGNVAVDPGLWEKIVINLLSNAFKHTFEGDIRVELFQSDGQVKLIVSDTGIGISEENLTKIFDRFQRVEGAHSRTHEGTGIGLAVVQELVKLHSGTISVESSLDTGSKFTISLPIGTKGSSVITERAEEVSKYAQSFIEEAQGWIESGKNVAAFNPNQQWNEKHAMAPCNSYILVADDNHDMNEYIVNTLSRYWPVKNVSNGKEALELMNTGIQPDLVVTDIMMPIMDGFELLKSIRCHTKMSGLQVIMLSAKAGEEATIEALEAGADDYLIKPFAANELIARVNAILLTAKIRSDVEEQKREEVENLNSQLQRSNKELEEFAYVASHDLQAPLRHISAYIEMLDTGDPSPDEKKQWMSFVRQGAIKMRMLIEDILAYSRVTRNSKLCPVNLDRLVREIVNRFEQEISNKNVKISIARLPTVNAVEFAVGQLFQNLISNALKFNKPGVMPEISIGLKEHPKQWEFSVTDNGIGMESRHLDCIFQVFSRLHGDQDFSGTGIGLSICKKVVEFHGGKIWAESELDVGTTFYFTLAKQ